MRIRIAVAALAIFALLTAAVPAAQAAPRKPFHCHYVYDGRVWWILPSYILHCDRVWN